MGTFGIVVDVVVDWGATVVEGGTSDASSSPDTEPATTMTSSSNAANAAGNHRRYCSSIIGGFGVVFQSQIWLT
jgi:hypothetical protein